MPLYQYKCHSCGRTKDEMRSVDNRNLMTSCKCGGIFKKGFAFVNLITDTNFSSTGEYDSRLCRNRSDKIQGRKDFYRRCDEKNLVPINKHEAMDIPSDSNDRVKKYVKTGNYV